jgi:crotonobetainyl-CoA:carnitine CoA-transferase CaiB-like acyl-CoA transferase
LPGNDQTAAAIAGVTWEDGGCAEGGRPMWSLTSLGDLGNGFLSAIGVLWALHHRNRTGAGSFVDTSIVYACLLNTSYAWTTEDGTPGPRPRLDGQQLGLSALYGLYPTARGWLCITAVTDDHWRRLVKALDRDDLGTDARFGSGAERARHDRELRAELTSTLQARSAAEWFDALDGAGVPCEIESDTFALGVFDDPELVERGWVTQYEQGLVGRLDQAGMLVDLSDTPGRVAGPPLVVGDSSRAILSGAGYTDGEIDALIADGIVLDAASGS